MPSLLSNEILGRFKSLDLIARYLVEGFITGRHRSPYHGFSVEFSEHRPYMPGDEIRHIDWHLYARTGRHYIKQFEEETNLRCYILVDGSASMAYGSGEINKFRWASLMAASLMYMMIRQQDAVGLVIFDEKIRVKMPPRSIRSYLNQLLSQLENREPANKTRTAETLHKMAESLKRRGLVILISDLFDDEKSLMQGLKHFRHMGHEVLVFHVLDPAERNFSLLKSTRFKDMETGEIISADPNQVAAAVNREMAEFSNTLKNQMRAEGIDYIEADISNDFDHVLLEYLIKRKRMA
jgi:uncharacterized protein (DUF58 family)